ncbi:hypothetical protein FRC02_006642 [Tulasnella sp. 418]|nr:hypothetical protein FRC02_006642 [Tulasnella sp. 418]
MLEHLSKLENLQHQLAAVGKSLDDEDLADVMIMSLPDRDEDQNWKMVASSLAAMKDRSSTVVHTKLLEEASRINGRNGSESYEKVLALVVHRHRKKRFHPYQGPESKSGSSD